MSKHILLTAAEEDAEQVLETLNRQELNILHYPLERYVPVDRREEITSELEGLDGYENIVYGNRRNARFFLEKIKEHKKIAAVRDCLNLTLDRPMADLLEEAGIPAICTHGEKKPINLVEFMLRLRRFGATLYPCGSHKKEEVPGFLFELDIPVTELELFDLEGPGENELKRYKKKIREKPPGTVLFHSRRSVTRTLAAFPQLDFDQITVISADTGISKKLREKGIEVDEEGEGNWASMLELL